ncbi:MAG TPA: mechanosensitive ion channel domain-containing protein [Nannocystaceae bacterium]|nr:mechanosensitive ion channel domain-containing protein [Nannocystaceae bacterium]
MDDLWTIARTHTSWLLALVVVVVFAILGQVFRSFALDRIAGFLERKTRTTLDEDIVRSLRRPVVLWFTLAGFYFAVLVMELDKEVEQVLVDLLSAVMIISLSVWFAELVVRLMVAAVPNKPGRASPITGVVQNVVRIFVMMVGLVLVLGNFGISVAPMLTGLGIGGLAVALGLQETLANVFAGMQLTIARNIRIGDILRLQDGEELVLEDIGWRATRMRRVFTEATVIIPNARLANDMITNFDQPTSEIGVLVDVGVHYKSDLRRVELVACEVGAEVMAEVDGGVPSYVPYLRFRKFGDSAVEFVIYLRAIGFRESTLVRSEFIMRLAERFASEGIVIPYPVRAINLDQEGALGSLVDSVRGAAKSDERSAHSP